MHYTEEENIPGLILHVLIDFEKIPGLLLHVLIDFEKAFDTVSWNFIQKY